MAISQSQKKWQPNFGAITIDAQEKMQDPPYELSTKERAVLSVFRTYLMTPGKMLCFNSPQHESFGKPLKQLIENGYVVAAKFKGGYQLTQTGFEAMKHYA